MSDLNWIFFVSSRFSKIDRKGRTAVTSWLASVGVCLGVMALIVIMSVMNGFQMSFIDSIMEISSYHVRVSGLDENEEGSFLDFCKKNRLIETAVPFYEAQGLMVSKGGNQSAAIIRAVPENVNEIDSGFNRELKIVSGRFDLSSPDSIVIGNTIAHELKLRKGSKVNIAALSGSNDSALLSKNRMFTVTGIFFCGYADINSGYAFISSRAGELNFGKGSRKTYGLKLVSGGKDREVVPVLKKEFDAADISSWKDYNRSFFWVLKMEKNILFLLVFLIFIVVAINIFNSMKRVVLERKEEIAILSAMGGSSRSIRRIFIMQGARTGFAGAIPGLFLGLFVSGHISTLFNLAQMVTGNPMFSAYARIPARIFPAEVLLIFIFGVGSSLSATWLAGRNILKMTVSEVLRDE